MNRKTAWGLALAVALAVGGYLAAAAYTYRLGFPLDDAWIFQTYARNLATGYGWVYFPGRPSVGATAPLWVLWQVPGVWLRLTPLVWPWWWGSVALVGLAWLGAAAWVRWAPSPARRWAWAVGLLLAWEWHLVWAALSGMETLLFTLGATAVVLGSALWGDGLGLGQIHRPNDKLWMPLGFAVGLMAWLRPEAVLLALPVGWALLVRYARRPWLGLRAALAVGLGMALPVLAYLGFNFAVGGRWWPNTFYAKQAEYAVLGALPWWTRAARVVAPLLAGPGALLVPGLLWGGWVAARQRRWAWFAGPLWALSHWAAYAWRLPVGYQHGRYALPILPVALLWGAWGLADLLHKEMSLSTVKPSRREPSKQHGFLSPRLGRRFVFIVWTLSAAGLTLAFLPLGARVYARDVAVIESQMVDPARWLAAHSAPDEVIAAHDIGALGYFASRPLVDLAGLINPDVIPWLGDPEELSRWVARQRPTYLMAFVGEYPYLETRCERLFRASPRFVALFDHPPMQVCRFFWR